jgi:phosphate starvation-inducible PhoH-like protein
MTKRSAKRSIKRAGKQQTEERHALTALHGSNVRPLFEDGWHPLGPAEDAPRDQSYVKNLRPRGDNQAELFRLIDSNPVVFATGPAGTGKTYVAVAKAVEALEAGRVGRIVLSRPAVEAGESLGFLPGDMEEKLSPYLRPLYDVLTDRLSAKQVRAMMQEGLIEVAPIAFMRGRTLNNAFVVIDEAQNCTYAQLKMLLTRLGWHSTMVITGDPAQSDLLPGVSGLAEIVEKLAGEEDIGAVAFTGGDVVRHPLVARMVERI